MNTPALTLSKATAFAALPPIWPEALQSSLKVAAAASGRTLVVLDDDPTGTQTVYDVPVVTSWEMESLRVELARALPCFFILTNSRSLSSSSARSLNRDLARNLRTASVLAQRPFTLISRGDSTLRGHFPAETDALDEVCGPFAATILAPYFEAGGRYTLNDIHYVAEGDALVPAGETPFARDATFAYRNSNLREWVEEKTAGHILASAVTSLPSVLFRRGGPKAVADALLALKPRSFCIANLAAPRDAEVLAAATLEVERAGKSFLYRTAASFVSARLGLPPRPLLTKEELTSPGEVGGLVVVGSHVPKTTAQLERLLATRSVHTVELDVTVLADPVLREGLLESALKSIADALAQRRNVVVSTSRLLLKGQHSLESLKIAQRVSEALVTVVRRLAVRPRFFLVKGGITSSDIATDGLNVRRAVVRGQILPGVPVWQLGPESRYPGLNYIVFPGNVGEIDALTAAFDKLCGA